MPYFFGDAVAVAERTVARRTVNRVAILASFQKLEIHRNHLREAASKSARRGFAVVEMLVIAEHSALHGAGYRHTVGTAVSKELARSLGVGLGLVLHTGECPLGKHIHRCRGEFGAAQSENGNAEHNDKESDKVDVAHGSGFQPRDGFPAGLLEQGFGVG